MNKNEKACGEVSLCLIDLAFAIVDAHEGGADPAHYPEFLRGQVDLAGRVLAGVARLGVCHTIGLIQEPVIAACREVVGGRSTEAAANDLTATIEIILGLERGERI